MTAWPFFIGDAAADDGYAACDAYLPKTRKVLGQNVGPESCLMRTTELSYMGRDYVRIDMGLDGTAEGYVKEEGPYHEYLTNVPDLTFAQAATPGEPQLAIARYERLRGSAILLVYPKARADWNGKLWVTAHGRGRSLRNGRLRIWDRYYDPDDPVAAFDKIDRVMFAKGYALAKTLRTTEQDIGEVIAQLEDGSIVDFTAFNDNAAIIKDFALIAQNALQKRLGRKPTRTYLYGHSAGARIARGLNYTRGLNSDARRQPIFDGYLLDDSATGLWLPIRMQDGEDVLLVTDEDKAAFRPQVEFVHQMYTKVWDRAPDRPDWVADAYLVNKRHNAKILLDKGLGDRFRMYEIRSMSHDGGEGLPPDNRLGKVRVLDVSLIIGGAIDKLDALVQGTSVPLASKSDWDQIGDVDADGGIDNPAIIYPEVACPLGVFYPYPQSGSYRTAYAAFTGDGVEPLDEARVFVDMNRNGVWDFRETPTQAWQRLGLLQPGEKLTHPRYVACVEDAVKVMQDEGFFTATTAARYVNEARAQSLDPKALVE
ncbi:MAG: hypothetical protein OEO82_09125 [Gammaproteobacteria bacterium]|nr:hypothetical protein [Gammaproteobacteria bacterium]